MDLTSFQSSASVTIDRDADSIYDLIADVSRMGEWSPVCTGGSYDSDDPAWFTGTNAIGDSTWETRCHVIAAERGKEFTFINHGFEGRHEMVRWGFTLRPSGEGQTEVTQSWEVLPGYEDGFAEETNPGMTLEQRLGFMQKLALSGMPETLAKLKVAAES